MVQLTAAEHAQDHLTLGNEAALAADDIALAHRAIRGDARVGHVVDADDIGQGLFLTYHSRRVD